MLDLIAKANAAQTNTNSETRAQAREALEASQHGVVSISATGAMVIHNAIALDVLNLPNCPLNQPLKPTEIPPQIAGLRILRARENQDVELLQVSSHRFARLHSRRVKRGGVVVEIGRAHV